LTEDVMTPEKADFRARCFVNGVRRHGVTKKIEPVSGEFHERFLSHPWVRESITEGWGMELRMHLIHVAKTRLMRKEQIGEVESLMPNKEWIAAAKTNADRYRKAAEWRDAKGGATISAEGLLKRFGIERPAS